MGIQKNWKWFLRRVLFWAILIYATVCGLLYVFQRSLIYPVLLITPFTSLRDVAAGVFPLFPTRWLVRDPMPLFEAWKNFAGPSCVVLAGRDEVIPRRASEPFRTAQGTNRKVVVMPDATHNGIRLDRATWEEWTRLGPP